LNKFISIVFCALLSIALAGCASTAADRPVGPTTAPMVRTDARTEFAAGMELALNGDMKAALPIFKEINPHELNEEQRTALAGVLAQFEMKTARNGRLELDPWIARVLDAYQHYWSGVMMGSLTAEDGERQLAAALAPLVGVTGRSGAAVEMDALEPAIQERILARGYFSLHGVTSPFREFMLWRTQEDKVYEVELPDGREAVSVAMLDDFVSLGWAGFATGDYYHTGGWATRERLFCVRTSYDLASEAFRVSYLTHEGQHFSDYKRFPNLEGPELEYRAKLAEIANADTTLYPLLQTFSEQASDKRENPHGYANRRLMGDLARALDVASPGDAWWTFLPPETIHAVAVRLFREDSQRLQPEGAR
jgi:hypothetical protein